MKKVFISSTSEDLQKHRAAVREAIMRLGLLPLDMALFGSKPQNALHVSLEKVREADIFVGILAHRYGYVPEGELISITEHEFREAQKAGKPCLMFLVKPDYAWPDELVEHDPEAQKRLHEFKAFVEKHLVRDDFTTPEDLALKVFAALYEQLNIKDTPSSFPTGAHDTPISATTHSTEDFRSRPVIYHSVSTEVKRLSPIANLTRPFWAGRVWRGYGKRVTAYYKQSEGLDRAFFELLGVVTPSDIPVYVDNRPFRITSLIFGTGELGGYRRLVLLGAPGSGKTTMLRFAAVAQARYVVKTRFRRKLIPLYIDLRFYSGGDFLQFLQSKVAGFGSEAAIALLHHELVNGRMTIYLDSLNEMPRANYDENILAINNFIDTYPHNQFIISCRKDEYRNEFRGNHALILPLDDLSIERYIAGYIPSAEQAQHVYNRLREEALLDLVRNPFSLSIVIKTGVIPRNKAQLFDAFVQMLIANDLSKGIQHRAYRVAQEHELQEMLTHLAYYLLVELRAQVVSKATCLSFLRSIAGDMAGSLLNQAVDALLIRYEDNQKLNVGFWHQSLLSYYTARYIARHWNKLGPTELSLILTEPEFWESVTLVGGVIADDSAREQLAEQIFKARPDVVGAAIAISILGGEYAAHLDDSLPDKPIYDDLKREINRFFGWLPDQAEPTHKLITELSAVVRLSESAILMQLVAKYMPASKSVAILSGVHSEESVGILVDHWLQRRMNEDESKAKAAEQASRKKADIRRVSSPSNLVGRTISAADMLDPAKLILKATPDQPSVPDPNLASTQPAPLNDSPADDHAFGQNKLDGVGHPPSEER